MHQVGYVGTKGLYSTAKKSAKILLLAGMELEVSDFSTLQTLCNLEKNSTKTLPSLPSPKFHHMVAREYLKNYF